MLSTSKLSYRYNNENPIVFPDINCAEGEGWLALGQSGCGKTTLLHLLGGLLKPQQGEILIQNKNIGSLSSNELDKFRGKNIGIIFQQSHFVRSLSVMKNLLLAPYFANEGSNKDRAKDLLERLNIGHKANSKTNELSQGEQQRVAIARALMNKPKLILADEPTSALDDVNTNEVIQLLKENAKAENATLIVVTHDNRLKPHFENKIEL